MTEMKPGSKKIGYARVSTEDQNLDLQLDALHAAGCHKIFKDMGVSATSKKRDGFENALAMLQAGDIFVIWKMDRAFRSLRNAMDTLEELQRRQVEFVSLTEEIDTTTPMGRAFYYIRNVFSELETDLNTERTKAGMQAARRRGQRLGRPKVMTGAQIRHARDLMDAQGKSLSEIARLLGVAKTTLWRALQ